MDSEREGGRLERCRPQLPLGDDPDECRRERTVRRQDSRIVGHPGGNPVLAVVVEERLFDLRIERYRLELTEARGARDLDDDQAPDGVELETPDLGDRAELLGVQPIEVADIPVQRADGDDGARIQQARSEHRPERVEVRAPVCRDDLLGAHRLIVAEPPASDTARRVPTASISTSAPLGSPEICTVERAGGRSPT